MTPPGTCRRPGLENNRPALTVCLLRQLRSHSVMHARTRPFCRPPLIWASSPCCCCGCCRCYCCAVAALALSSLSSPLPVSIVIVTIGSDAGCAGAAPREGAVRGELARYEGQARRALLRRGRGSRVPHVRRRPLLSLQLRRAVVPDLVGGPSCPCGRIEPATFHPSAALRLAPIRRPQRRRVRETSLRHTPPR